MNQEYFNSGALFNRFCFGTIAEHNHSIDFVFASAPLRSSISALIVFCFGAIAEQHPIRLDSRPAFHHRAGFSSSPTQAAAGPVLKPLPARAMSPPAVETPKKQEKKRGGAPSSSQPAKKLKVLPENVCVPAKSVQPEQGVDVPPQAEASASTRSHDGIVKPWGVDEPHVMPPLPGDDASPTTADVLKLVKAIAAYVVTTLPTFFKNNIEEFKALGFEVEGDKSPSAYDALTLSQVLALVS